MDEVYEVVMECANCGAVVTVEIPRGVYICGHIVECPNCGCEVECLTLEDKVD